jgi:hypothetical protein
MAREVIINDEHIEWSSSEHPLRCDEDKFILIQVKTARKTFKPSLLTMEIVRNFRGKEVNVFIHIYSDSVASQNVYKSVEKALIEPGERDRARADTVQVQQELANQLKEILYIAEKMSGLCFEFTLQAFVRRECARVNFVV